MVPGPNRHHKEVERGRVKKSGGENPKKRSWEGPTTRTEERARTGRRITVCLQKDSVSSGP